MSALFGLINACEIPFDLGSGSEHSQKVRLGNELKRIQDRRFGNLKVEHVGEAHRANLWRLVSVGPPLTHHSLTEMPVNIGPGESHECGESFGPDPGPIFVQGQDQPETPSVVGTEDSPHSPHSPAESKGQPGVEPASGGRSHNREILEI